MINPTRNFVAVTPNDSADLPGGECIGLQVGHTGLASNVQVSVVNGHGDTVVLSTFSGGFLPIRTKRVRATGTTADEIVALYPN